MAFNGVGVYNPPVPPDFPAVTGQTIQASHYNTVVNDIATALTKCVTRDGQTPIQANLPMTGFKHTGVVAATAADEYMTLGQFTSLARIELTGLLTAFAGNLTWDGAAWRYIADGFGAVITMDRSNGVITTYSTATGLAGAVATLIKTSATGAHIAGFKASTHYIEGVQGGVSGAQFTLTSALLDATWESVGPTGSGAANIWAALDVAGMATTTYVAIKGRMAAASSSTDFAGEYLYARKTGTINGAGSSTEVASAYIKSAGAAEVNITTSFNARIPVDTSGRFDLYHVKTAGGNGYMVLAGFGQ